MPTSGTYALLAIAVLAESGVLVGAFIPTLTLLLTAGALARAGPPELALVIAIAAAAVAGDAAAHQTGHLMGSRLRNGRLGRRIPATVWDRATALISARGGQAVFICRFLPIIRTLTPHIAGATALPYRNIAPYSATAALVWAGAEAGAGYAAAASTEHLAGIGSTMTAIAAATVLLAAVLWTAVRRRGLRKTRGGSGDHQGGGRMPGPLRRPPLRTTVRTPSSSSTTTEPVRTSPSGPRHAQERAEWDTA
ncbi:DedA family protein [Streptomyces sp. AP-93]|uniref:DedA family protein n=1 Tax=Streptomyces sp. AP-93 TaxID=2929048 RepID=UPI001FAF5E3B|nr:VTT domain-containing protein [Streptomyces sp. AP-93]MCJ0872611.1 VTT domain-containing protein [Streptomyces sp. AP-93]